MKRLSKTTLGLVAYIILSAIFMFQVRAWLIERLGEYSIVLYFKIVFLLLFLLVVHSTGKNRIIAVFFVFILAYLFSMWQPYLSEKMHVLTYGLLGFLTVRDVTAGSLGWFKKSVFVLLFVALVSFCDEMLQAFLPWRVCDLRDVVTNIISGVLGAGVFCASQGNGKTRGVHE